jgi:hypothetical protein
MGGGGRVGGPTGGSAEPSCVGAAGHNQGSQAGHGEEDPLRHVHTSIEYRNRACTAANGHTVGPLRSMVTVSGVVHPPPSRGWRVWGNRISGPLGSGTSFVVLGDLPRASLALQLSVGDTPGHLEPPAYRRASERILYAVIGPTSRVDLPQSAGTVITTCVAHPTILGGTSWIVAGRATSERPSTTAHPAGTCTLRGVHRLCADDG